MIFRFVFMDSYLVILNYAFPAYFYRTQKQVSRDGEWQLPINNSNYCLKIDFQLFLNEELRDFGKFWKLVR